MAPQPAVSSAPKSSKTSGDSTPSVAAAPVTSPASGAIPPAPTLPPSELNIDALVYVEQMQEAYAQDPLSVPADWQHYFRTVVRSSRPQLGPSFPTASLFHAVTVTQSTFGSAAAEDAAALQEKVDQLIRNYRLRGHIAAKVDPLGSTRPFPAELNPEFYGFTDKDLDKPFSTIRSRFSVVSVSF